MQAIANVLLMLFYNRDPRCIPERIQKWIDIVRKNIKVIPDGAYTDIRADGHTWADECEFTTGLWNFEDKYMSLSFLISNLKKLGYFEENTTGNSYKNT